VRDVARGDDQSCLSGGLHPPQGSHDALKVLTTRDRDLEDASSVIASLRSRLDLGYVRDEAFVSFVPFLVSPNTST
jgi:hypothetical protein